MPRTTHLEARQLDALRRGTLDTAETRRIRSHLAEACAGCARRVAEILVERYGDLPRPAGRSEPRLVRASALPAGSYVRHHVEAAAWEEAVAPGLARSLELWEEAEAFRIIGDEPTYRTHALASHLTEESRRVVIVDTSRGYHLGRLAVAVAAYAPKERYGPGLCADLKGEAALALVNAARCRSLFYEARRALQMAKNFLEEGTGDFLLGFRFSNDRASLLRALGYYRQALQSYESGLDLLQRIPNFRASTGLRLKRAILLVEVDPVRAFRVQRSLVEHFQQDGQRWLAFCAATCLVDCLGKMGRRREAYREFRRLERAHGDLASTRHHARIRQQRALILRALGRYDEAWEILEELYRETSSSDLTLDSANLRIVLSTTAYGFGRESDARRYAAEAASFYSSMGAGLYADQSMRLVACH